MCSDVHMQGLSSFSPNPTSTLEGRDTPATRDMLGVRWGEQGVHLLLYSFSSELLDLTAAWGPAETQGRKV